MKENTFKINVNQQFNFDLKEADVQLDMIEENGSTFHILKDNQSYKAEVLHANFEKKIITLRINGTPYEVTIEDTFDQLVQQLGLSITGDQKVDDVKAPMPGLVLEVAVEVGQTVKKGDGLLILEAMKMENVIKSAGEGTVKAIHTEQGVAVEKGALLIEME